MIQNFKKLFQILFLIYHIFITPLIFDFNIYFLLKEFIFLNFKFYHLAYYFLH